MYQDNNLNQSLIISHNNQDNNYKKIIKIYFNKHYKRKNKLFQNIQKVGLLIMAKLQQYNVKLALFGKDKNFYLKVQDQQKNRPHLMLQKKDICGYKGHFKIFP